MSRASNYRAMFYYVMTSLPVALTDYLYWLLVWYL